MIDSTNKNSLLGTMTIIRLEVLLEVFGMIPTGCNLSTMDITAYLLHKRVKLE
jgi:hypothetical protein